MILHLSWRYWRACRTWEWNSKIDNKYLRGSSNNDEVKWRLILLLLYQHTLDTQKIHTFHDFLTNMVNLFFLLNSRRYKQGKTEWSHRLLHPHNLMKTVWYIDFNISIGLKNWVSQNSTIYTIIKALFYDLIIASSLQAFIISLFLPQLNH